MPGESPSFHPGGLHYIPPGLSAFEPACRHGSPTNTLLWIGGLFDTPGHVAYPFALASQLPAPWSLAVLSLSSAGKAWGTTTLAADVAELARVVAYFHSLRPGGKVVLMGHSTGCQDALLYVSSSLSSAAADRPRVHGVVLQAPVSDRQAMVAQMGEAPYAAANAVARDFVQRGREGDCLPMEVLRPLGWELGVSARRWLDLASPDKDGADDMFSSDLSDHRLEATFGAIRSGTGLLVLSSGADEYVPQHIVDVPAMLKRWVTCAQRAGAKVHPKSSSPLPGATHDLNAVSEGVLQELVDRVVGFLESID